MADSNEPSVPERHDPYASLRFPEFRLFLAARFSMTICFQMIAVIVGWQVYDVTKDPLDLGLIGLVEAVPNIIVALLAGHVADRYDRKRIIILTMAMGFLCALFLLLYAMPFAKPFHQTYGIFPIFAVVFMIGLARGFMTPAFFAFLAQIVPRAVYANSSAWSSNMWQVAAIAGPALGGLIYGFYGLAAAYGIAAFSIFIAIVMIFLIAAQPLPYIPKKEAISTSIATGLKFVFSRPVILGALTLDLFAVLFGGAVALLPVFAGEILKVGPQGLGLLRAAPAVGAVLMALILAHQPPMQKAGRNLLYAVAGFGLCMIGFALSKSFILSLVLLTLSGMLDNVSVVIRSTVLQLLTPDHMRGRVSAVNSIFIGSSNEIGAFESGFAAKLMGVIPSVIFGGCMTLIVVLSTARFAPGLRRLNMAKLSQAEES